MPNENFYQRRTKRNYDFFECSSAMQKAIRRNDAKIAGYFALELEDSGFGKYVWKRFLIISCEDIYGIITKEIWALKQAYDFIPKTYRGEGKLFIAKAAILLATAIKSRDADHLICLVFNDGRGLENGEVEKFIEEVREDYAPIPEYAYDMHTLKGKAKKMTRDDFIRQEFEALEPRQAGMFDDLIPKN